MNLKDKICVLLTVLFAFTANSQYYKEKISIVLFKADFVPEVSMKAFRNQNIYTFDFENTKHENYFIDEYIEFLPTIILYNNGQEVYRVEAGITLKMPEDYEELLKKQINKLIENKF